MKVIGITGGVGAGKSFILEYLEQNYQVEILLTDLVAKELMEPGSACNALLQETFSKEQVFDAEGRILREEMAALLFSDEEARRRLNAIVHPAVKDEVKRRIEQAMKENLVDCFFVESALLIEDHYDELCEELWYIYTTEENRRLRLKNTRGYSDEKIDSIFASQLGEEEFRQHTNVWIDNNQGKDDVALQIKREMQRLVG